MIIDLNNNSAVPYMGIFGLSWEEKVASFVKKRLSGTSLSKKLSDFFQSGGLNVSLIKNLYNEYAAFMAVGNPPSDFDVLPNQSGDGGEFKQTSLSLASKIESKTNVDFSIILEFLRALFVLSRDGKIPFEKWNPQGYKESTQLRKTFDTEKSILDTIVKPVSDKASGLILIVGVGVTAYLLSQLKFFTYKKQRN